LTIELTPYQANEIRRLQKVVKFYESMISILLIAVALSFVAYLAIGFLSWFIDGIWSPEWLKLCSLFLSRGCQPFFSEIYGLNLFLDLLFNLNILFFITLSSFVLFIFFYRSLNTRLDRIDAIKALTK
jgi:ABC-type multidrug transport system fused ATPase/permease subunit